MGRTLGNHSRKQIHTTRKLQWRLMGNSLGGASMQQLHQLERQLSDGLILIKEKKDAMLFEEIVRSNLKERGCDYE
ncbi:hypothetical protein L1987_50268 [Smallanthus sonchifolius]|uniref:Uncharacterized protein n=1 Tax=Smallanthus sonchifolius TaxID=185202 RepID=A0ACB9ELR8_9ASTR|nr:hypothetical protein L1987_50268 [Smallanthus sonchifolius]